jgi:hypothetical protein
MNSLNMQSTLDDQPTETTIGTHLNVLNTGHGTLNMDHSTINSIGRDQYNITNNYYVDSTSQNAGELPDI